MTDRELLEMARKGGFTPAIIPTGKVVVDGKFRAFCEENLCGNFNANYACPPDCGTVEETTARLMARGKALVLQSVWEIGSYDNKDGIQKAKRTNNASILRLMEQMRRAGIPCFCLGYGGCPLCDPCMCVMNQPCAHPDKKISCMSAYCIDVAKLAQSCELEFSWDPEKLFLFGMILFD